MSDHHLKFIGQPGQYVAGVPASDITVGAKREADELIAGGLYELVLDSPSKAAEKEA